MSTKTLATTEQPAGATQVLHHSRELVVSHSTAKCHVSNVISKLGVCGRTEAVAQALQHHLVPDIEHGNIVRDELASSDRSLYSGAAVSNPTAREFANTRK